MKNNLASPDQSTNSDSTRDLFNINQSNQCFIGKWTTDKYNVNRSYIPTVDAPNTELYFSEFVPSSTAIIAAIVVVHGFGEHQGRYIHLADWFASHGYKVYLYDQRGFGHSGGQRGNSTIEQMHQDLELVLKKIDRALPIFLYCHSLGAAQALSFCIINPSLNFQGIIATSALTQVPKRITFGKKCILRFLNKFCPDIQVNSYIDWSHCTKNNFYFKKMANDPLIYPYLTIRMAYNIQKLGQFLPSNANKFKIPIYLMHGKLDKIAPDYDSIDFYRKCSSKEKSIKIFDYGFHEMEQDQEWDKIKQLALSWCNKMCFRDRKISNLRELSYNLKPRRNQLKQWLKLPFIMLLILKFRKINIFLLLLILYM